MNDEHRALISAYHDNQLDAAGEQAARELLEQNEAARRYHDEIRQCDRLLRGAYDPIAARPAPDMMVAALRREARRPARVWISLAMAASLLVLAVLVGRQTATDVEMEQQLIEMRQQIAELRHQTLENTPSGNAASWIAPAGGVRAEVTPLKTYRTGDNRFCREYEERIEDETGVEVRRGIACRAGKALWPDSESGLQLPGQDTAAQDGKQVTL